MTRPWHEGDALRVLDHPNIVKVLASGSESGDHYIVMELVAGGSLADLLSKEGCLPIGRTVGIALELADALTRSHHLKIVHRDIKPGNVLLAQDGTPRLTDFGVARIGESAFTGSGNVIGTHGYISPEALHGHGSDTRGDIWAFGVLLYEMLAGRRPFATAYGSAPVAEIMGILKERPPELDELRPEVPIALVDLVGRMLEKEPQQRIPSMRRVGAELESIQVGADAPSAMSEEQTFERGRFAEASSSSPLRHNLPLQPTPFVGREQELAEVVSLLEPPDARLVTLVGPGGMGKTRLAIEAARALGDAFSGGACFVPLAGLADSSQILSRVADAVGYSFSGPEDPKRQLLNFLREKSLLLILDGFEYLIEETALLADVVTEAAGVKLLATSRERLQLRFESFYECGGMQVPTLAGADDARSFGAVRLFETSARRARPDFELADEDVAAVVDICRLVMGMPLGIELAAAWIAMLSPKEIVDEVKKSFDFLETDMRDVPERHRSVRALFDASWNLLKPGERDALARLAVFRGGFDRGAANEVSGAGLRTVARLVSKSLLKRNPAGRYEQHDLVKQFAWEHLESSGQAEQVREHHADYFCDYVERLERRLRGRTQGRALGELERELDNVRATWEWALETKRLDVLSRLVESLFRFFEMKGRFRDGQKLFGETAALIHGDDSNGDAAQVLRARLLARQGRFGHRLGGCQQARAILEKSLAMAREYELKGEVAFCLENLADVTSLLGEYETSNALAKEALTVCEEIGDRWTMESVLNNLGVVSYQQKKFDDAAKYYRESLEVAREIGDPMGVGIRTQQPRCSCARRRPVRGGQESLPREPSGL